MGCFLAHCCCADDPTKDLMLGTLAAGGGEKNGKEGKGQGGAAAVSIYVKVGGAEGVGQNMRTTLDACTCIVFCFAQQLSLPAVDVGLTQC
jgi:hypothetical protein